jgi:hypothetical protein
MGVLPAFARARRQDPSGSETCSPEATVDD